MTDNDLLPKTLKPEAYISIPKSLLTLHFTFHMISFSEAFQIILDNKVFTSGEEVPLNEACGRVLFQDVYSDMDMPPFDKSAVDGFACRLSDIHNKQIGVETIAARMKVTSNW
jgi:molybdopterin biosynthesis enzyme